MLIVGTYPTQKCNDKAELKKCIESVPDEVEKEEKDFVCADTGYFSNSLIEETEKEHPELKVLCAVGRTLHGKTVEPAFGIIKRVMGFRQFLMCGLENIGIEWDLVTISYNLSRMVTLKKLAFAKN